MEGQGAGAEDRVRDLNTRLEQARIAAGLIALTGSGIVLQLEDSRAPVPPGGRESDYLVGSRDIRAVVEELWGAGAEAIAVNGERITPTSAIIDVGSSLLINSAYLSPPYQVSALGPKELYGRLSASPGFIDFVRARGEGFGIRISLAEPDSVDVPAFVGHRHASLLALERDAVDTPFGRAQHGGEALTMHRRRSQLTIAAVAFVLGLLVVVQLRSQAGEPGFAQLSSQDLTVLVANLNARNDQLRREGSTPRA